MKDALENKFETTEPRDKELQQKFCKVMRAVHSTVVGVAAIFAGEASGAGFVENAVGFLANAVGFGDNAADDAQPRPLLTLCLQRWVKLVKTCDSDSDSSAATLVGLGSLGDNGNGFGVVEVAAMQKACMAWLKQQQLQVSLSAQVGR